MDIKTLEQHIYIDKNLRTKENWLILYDRYASIYPTLTPKEKYKLTFKIGNFIVNAFKSGNYSADDLKYYLSLLKKFPTNPRHISQILSKYYELIGGEPKIISTKFGVVGVESGTLAVSDINFTPSESLGMDDFNKKLISDMNEGKVFYWSTGGDGNFDITLRHIDGLEPSATSKEYKFIINSTNTSIISVPSGQISITDIGIDATNSPVKITVKPGNYLVRVHHKNIHGKYYGYVVVVCETNQDAINNVKEIEGLD